VRRLREDAAGQGPPGSVSNPLAPGGGGDTAGAEDLGGGGAGG
jgi:hypothetical protein